MDQLSRILAGLISDKAKERSESHALLKQLLPTINISLNHQHWRTVLENFVESIVLEREVFEKQNTTKKKPTVAQTQKLRLLSQDLYSMISLAEDHLQSSLIEPILDHVLNNVIVNSRLFEPFALQYSKILKLLLSHADYRQHLSFNAWSAIVDVVSKVTLSLLDNLSLNPRSAELIEISNVFALLTISCPKDISCNSMVLLGTLKEFITALSSNSPALPYFLSSLLQLLLQSLPNNQSYLISYLNEIINSIITKFESKVSPTKYYIICILRIYLNICIPPVLKSTYGDDASKLFDLESSYYSPLHASIGALYKKMLADITTKGGGMGILVESFPFISLFESLIYGKNIGNPLFEKYSSTLSINELMIMDHSHFKVDPKSLSKLVFLDYASSLYFEMLKIFQERRKETVVDGNDVILIEKENDFLEHAPKRSRISFEDKEDLIYIIQMGSCVRETKIFALQIFIFLLKKNTHNNVLSLCSPKMTDTIDELSLKIVDLLNRQFFHTYAEDFELLNMAYLCLAMIIRRYHLRDGDTNRSFFYLSPEKLIDLWELGINNVNCLTVCTSVFILLSEISRMMLSLSFNPVLDNEKLEISKQYIFESVFELAGKDNNHSDFEFSNLKFIADLLHNLRNHDTYTSSIAVNFTASFITQDYDKFIVKILGQFFRILFNRLKAMNFSCFSICDGEYDDTFKKLSSVSDLLQSLNEIFYKIANTSSSPSSPSLSPTPDTDFVNVVPGEVYLMEFMYIKCITTSLEFVLPLEFNKYTPKSGSHRPLLLNHSLFDQIWATLNAFVDELVNDSQQPKSIKNLVKASSVIQMGRTLQAYDSNWMEKSIVDSFQTKVKNFWILLFESDEEMMVMDNMLKQEFYYQKNSLIVVSSIFESFEARPVENKFWPLDAQEISFFVKYIHDFVDSSSSPELSPAFAISNDNSSMGTQAKSRKKSKKSSAFDDFDELDQQVNISTSFKPMTTTKNIGAGSRTSAFLVSLTCSSLVSINLFEEYFNVDECCGDNIGLLLKIDCLKIYKFILQNVKFLEYTLIEKTMLDLVKLDKMEGECLQYNSFIASFFEAAMYLGSHLSLDFAYNLLAYFAGRTTLYTDEKNPWAWLILIKAITLVNMTLDFTDHITPSSPESLGDIFKDDEEIQVGPFSKIKKLVNRAYTTLTKNNCKNLKRDVLIHFAYLLMNCNSGRLSLVNWNFGSDPVFNDKKKTVLLSLIHHPNFHVQLFGCLNIDKISSSLPLEDCFTQIFSNLKKIDKNHPKHDENNESFQNILTEKVKFSYITKKYALFFQFLGMTKLFFLDTFDRRIQSLDGILKIFQNSNSILGDSTLIGMMHYAFDLISNRCLIGNAYCRSSNMALVILKETLPYILINWDGLFSSSFPYKVFGYPDFERLFRDHAAFIIGRYLSTSQFDQIDMILSKTPNLLVETLPAIMPFILINSSDQERNSTFLYFSTKIGNLKSKIKSCQRELVVYKVISAAHSRPNDMEEPLHSFDKHISELLASIGLVWNSGNKDSIPNYSRSSGSIVEALKKYCEITDMSEIRFLLTANTNVLIMQLLQKDMKNLTVFSHQRHQFLLRLKLIVLINTKEFSTPLLLRWSLIILVDLMKFSDVVKESGGILLYLVDYIRIHRPTMFQKSLSFLISTLADFVYHLSKQLSPEVGFVSDVLVKVLSWGYEAANCRDILQVALAQLNPLEPIFQSVLDKYKEQGGNFKPDSSPCFLLQLLKQKPYSQSACFATVQYIYQALLADENVYGNTELCKSLASYLLSVLSGDYKGHMRVLASKCIGLLIAFVKEVNINDEFAEKDEKGIYVGHRIALDSILPYLFDASIEIRCLAAEACKSVFKYPIGQKVLLSNPKSELSFYLDVFVITEESRKFNFSPPVLVMTELCNLLVSAEPFERWISNLANYIISNFETDEFFASFCTVNTEIPDFALIILPYIIHMALLKETTENDTSLKLLFSKALNTFFNKSDVTDRKLKCLIQVLKYLRTREHPSSSHWLFENEFSNFDISKAAFKCKAYSISLFYLELSYEPLTPEKVNHLMAVYEHLSSDGFNGALAVASKQDLNRPGYLQRKYIQDQEWNKLFKLEESKLNVLSNSISSDLLLAMSRLGLHRMLGQHFSNLFQAGVEINEEMSEYNLECKWRNSQWDNSLMLDSGSDHFHRNLYESLSKVRDHAKIASTPLSLDHAFNSFSKNFVLKNWQQVNVNIETSLLPLVSLIEIEEAPKISALGNCEDLLKLWSERKESMMDQYGFSKNVETCLAVRTIGLKNLPASSYQGNVLRSHLLDYARLSRKAGMLQHSQTAVNQLVQLSSSSVFSKIEVDLLSAKLLWEHGDQTSAISLLRNTSIATKASKVLSNDSVMLGNLSSKVLLQTGIWSGINRSETASTIINNYFIAAAKGTTDSDISCRAYYNLARYADAQYELLSSNETISVTQELLSHKEHDLEACRKIVAHYKKPSTSAADNQQRKRLDMQIRQLEIQIKSDRDEIKRHNDELEAFLKHSLKGYSESLLNDKRDLAVFRLISLWLANSITPFVNDRMKTTIEKVPTHKFISMIYQISSRLDIVTDESQKDFQNVLSRLLEKIIQDHPHHSIYQLIALKNSCLNDKTSEPMAKQKEKAAIDLLNRVRKKSPELSKIILAYEKLCNSYIDLALYRVKEADKRKITISISRKSDLFTKITEFISIPITTLEIQPSSTKNYKNAPTIVQFKAEFKLVGGVTMPKLIECTGSDGVVYKQLLKSNDDLRQDAVLSCIFKIVNVLLSKNIETRKRNLFIRTFKVVPLSPRTGILQWVENTIPIGGYLVPAHLKYYPNDIKPGDARKKILQEHARVDSTNESKNSLLLSLFKKFHPVFRYFFFENFSDTQQWFDKRLCYTRSVASSSIIGYVVGLGDRHAQNILIDKKTAEVIHIDLGIAFDQGKLLPTPEQVPFRLTRDVIDGFGVLGVEGPFRRSCEEVLKLLRKESYIVLTLLDVFRHDPLHQWTTSPLKNQQRQQEGFEFDDSTIFKPEPGNMVVEEAKGNKDAERAIVAVTKKLCMNQSVEFQVNELIEQAVCTRGLSRMFAGWQAYLDMSLKERARLAKHYFNDIERYVVKSTSRKVKPLKPKHVKVLSDLTWQNSQSIDLIFDLLRKRMGDPHWVSVYKTLILTHILIKEGNSERILRYLMGNQRMFDMNLFRDKSSSLNGSIQSKNIRNYAAYLLAKIIGFSNTDHDYVSAKDEAVATFRSFPYDDNASTEALLTMVEGLQKQLKALLDCNFYFEEIDNLVTLQCFRLLLGDAMALFHLLNEGTIKILSFYFEMPRNLCSRALDCYKVFVKQTDETVELFAIARKLRNALGIEVPALTHAPTSLTGGLEEYLNSPDFEANRVAAKLKRTQKRNAKFSSPSKTEKLLDLNFGNHTTEVETPSVNRTTSPPLIAVEKEQIDFFASLDEASDNFNSPQNQANLNLMQFSSFFDQPAVPQQQFHQQQFNSHHQQQQQAMFLQQQKQQNAMLLQQQNNHTVSPMLGIFPAQQSNQQHFQQQQQMLLQSQYSQNNPFVAAAIKNNNANTQFTVDNVFGPPKSNSVVDNNPFGLVASHNTGCSDSSVDSSDASSIRSLPQFRSPQQSNTHNRFASLDPFATNSGNYNNNHNRSFSQPTYRNNNDLNRNLTSLAMKSPNLPFPDSTSVYSNTSTTQFNNNRSEIINNDFSSLNPFANVRQQQGFDTTLTASPNPQQHQQLFTSPQMMNSQTPKNNPFHPQKTNSSNPFTTNNQHQPFNAFNS